MKNELIEIKYQTNSGEFNAEPLLPCPFCGGEAELTTIGNNYTKSRKSKVKCKKCRVQVIDATLRHDLEWCSRHTIKNWNTRQLLSEPSNDKTKL